MAQKSFQSCLETLPSTKKNTNRRRGDPDQQMRGPTLRGVVLNSSCADGRSAPLASFKVLLCSLLYSFAVWFHSLPGTNATSFFFFLLHVSPLIAYIYMCIAFAMRACVLGSSSLFSVKQSHSLSHSASRRSSANRGKQQTYVFFFFSRLIATGFL